MTGTPTDASTECGHPASALLDFHVNGSLEGEEAAMVAAHVAECATCARDVRELRSISAAIEEHGVAPAAALPRGRRLWAWIGTAAALLVVATVVELLVRQTPSGTRIASAPPSGGAPAGREQALDLGVGGMRDGGAVTPDIELEPDTATLRLTLTHPAPGVDLRFDVRGPGGVEIVAAEPLPSHDTMGRVTIAIPASRLAAPGLHEVVLTAATPEAGGGTFTYPFEVRRPGGG